MFLNLGPSRGLVFNVTIAYIYGLSISWAFSNNFFNYKNNLYYNAKNNYYHNNIIPMVITAETFFKTYRAAT